MKGGLVHENVLLEPVERAFRERGAEAKRQTPTRAGHKGGYGDLVVVLGPRQLLVEAEMSSRRIANDLQKALELGATWLWIIVPNRRVAGAVRRRLKHMQVREAQPWLCVLTLGQALERVRKCVPLFSASMTGGKTNKDGCDAPHGRESGRPPAERRRLSQDETEETGNDY